MQRFEGFPPQTIPFLKELARNNDRNWFDSNKPRYEQFVREPALAFIAEMAPKLRGISIEFNAIAKKTGGSLMRIYRDTRFSKDKTPYKTNIGIQFRHVMGQDIHAPGFYLHIEPGECFIGAGIWHPEGKVLARIRDFIADNPAAWQAALAHKPFHKNYQLAGESLIRPPKGYAADHPLIEDLKRKDFIALRSFEDNRIESPNFIDFVTRCFTDSTPLVRYLCTAVDVSF